MVWEEVTDEILGGVVVAWALVCGGLGLGKCGLGWIGCICALVWMCLGRAAAVWGPFLPAGPSSTVKNIHLGPAAEISRAAIYIYIYIYIYICFFV